MTSSGIRAHVSEGNKYLQWPQMGQRKKKDIDLLFIFYNFNQLLGV